MSPISRKFAASIAVVIILIAAAASLYYLWLAPKPTPTPTPSPSPTVTPTPTPTPTPTVTPTPTLKPPIKVGAALPLTGTWAKFGTYMKMSYELWAEKVNKEGGLLGRQVELIVYDDESKSENVVSLYEKLITVDRVDIVLGPYGSTLNFAASTVTEKYKMPMVMGCAAAEKIYERGYKYIFGIMQTARHYSDTFFEFLETVTPKPKTIAVIAQSVLFSVQCCEGVRANAENIGLDVIFYEEYEKGTTDFVPLLMKIKPLNPDIFAVCGYIEDAIAITRQCKEIDFNPKAYWFSVGPAMTDYPEALGKDAEYVFSGVQWVDVLKYPGVEEFKNMWKEKYPEKYPIPHYVCPCSYVSCLVIEDAVKRAGTVDPEKLRDAIAETEFTYILPVKFDPKTGRNIGIKMPLIQIQHGKTNVVVWPKEVATAEAWYPTPSWAERP